MSSSDEFKVVIAGAGVAGLEAVLALRELLGSRVEPTVLAPEERFSYRPLAVAEPFGFAPASEIPLAELVGSAGGVLRPGRLAEVRADEHAAVTSDGEELRWDALLLALGARPGEVLPGAISYGGRESNVAVRAAVRALKQREIRSLAFAVPPTVRWPLPLYELALLTAAHLADHGVDDAELTIATPEAEPLGMFGERASSQVRRALDDAGIALRTSTAPASAKQGALVLMSGETVEAERVITLPRLEVAPITGVTQGPHGFIGTDRFMRVEGTTRVWAAGDATWFPIKQGGVATQQADAAASAIARCAESSVEAQPFTPVLRAALLTGSGPRYLRSEIGARDHASAAGAAPLWWPPAKIAGRRLAPFLAARGALGDERPDELEDLEPLHGEELDLTVADHREAVELALTAAEGDARWDDYAGALRWLDVAEQLDLTLPAEYGAKREAWAARAGKSGDLPGAL